MKQKDIVCRCLTRLTPLFQMLYYKSTATLYSRCKLSSSYSPVYMYILSEQTHICMYICG